MITASSSTVRTVDRAPLGPVGRSETGRPLLPLGDRLGIDPVSPGKRPQALLTMLYRSTDCLCRRGAPMKNLAHSASFESLDKVAPSKPGTKQLDQPRQTYAESEKGRGFGAQAVEKSRSAPGFAPLAEVSAETQSNRRRAHRPGAWPYRPASNPRGIAAVKAPRRPLAPPAPRGSRASPEWRCAACAGARRAGRPVPRRRPPGPGRHARIAA